MNRIIHSPNKNEITLILFHNNQIFSFPVDQVYSLSTIITNVFNHFSLDPSQHELTYNNKPIKPTDKRTLKSFLGANTNNPTFTIRSKTILSSVGNSLIKGTKTSILSTSSTSSQAPTLVHISNIVTNQVISEQLHEYYNEHSIPSQPKITFNKGNNATITLPSYKHAMNFIKKVNKLKQYPLYKQIHAEIMNNDVKGVTSSTTNNNNNNNSKATHRCATMLSPIKTDNTLSEYYGEFDVGKRKKEKKVLDEFYKRQEFIRNSSPYVADYELRVKKEKEDKKNWYDQKGFILSVGRYSMKPTYIANYVTLTKSESPLNHKFRNVEKKKWMTEKGFC